MALPLMLIGLAASAIGAGIKAGQNANANKIAEENYRKSKERLFYEKYANPLDSVTNKAILSQMDRRLNKYEDRIANQAAAGGATFENVLAAKQASNEAIADVVSGMMQGEQARQDKFNQQLPEALATMTNALRAGFSLSQAFDSVVSQEIDPMSEEFRILQQQLRIGMSFEDALESLSQRVGSDDLTLVTTAILISRKTGGNVTENGNGSGGSCVFNAYGAVLVFSHGNSSFRLKLFKIAVNGGSGFYIKLGANFANGGRIAVFFDEIRHIIQNQIGFVSHKNKRSFQKSELSK
jgi:hypothetical protein